MTDVSCSACNGRRLFSVKPGQYRRLIKTLSGYLLEVGLDFEFADWSNQGALQADTGCKPDEDLLLAIDDVTVNLSWDKEPYRDELFLSAHHHGSLSSRYPTSRLRQQPESVTLNFRLSAEAVDAMESRRKGGDALLSLRMSALCSIYLGDNKPNCHSNTPKRLVHRERLQNTSLSFSVPQSDWVRLLEASGYSLSILVETPIPETGTDSSYAGCIASLKTARQHFNSGNFSASVAECRKALELAGKIRKLKEFGDLVADFSSREKRELKSLRERFEMLFRAAYTVTHLAHHAESEHSESQVSRSTAASLLSITVACVSLAIHGELPDRATSPEPNKETL